MTNLLFKYVLAEICLKYEISFEIYTQWINDISLLPEHLWPQITLNTAILEEQILKSSLQK